VSIFVPLLSITFQRNAEIPEGDVIAELHHTRDDGVKGLERLFTILYDLISHLIRNSGELARP
jgi:hypothetical protein